MALGLWLTASEHSQGKEQPCLGMAQSPDKTHGMGWLTVQSTKNQLSLKRLLPQCLGLCLVPSSPPSPGACLPCCPHLANLGGFMPASGFARVKARAGLHKTPGEMQLQGAPQSSLFWTI